MGFYKNYTIILDRDNKKFTVKSSHHPKSVSVQSYNIIPIIPTSSPILLQIKAIDNLYSPISIQDLGLSKIKKNTMIINKLPTKAFKHSKYGLIFSDPCIAPISTTSRSCARYTKNEYYLEFEVSLLKPNGVTGIPHDSIILQLLVETY